MHLPRFRVASLLICLGLGVAGCKGKDAPTDASAAADGKAGEKTSAAEPGATPPATGKPPPCKDLLTAADIKKACGINVTFADIPLHGAGKEYRCAVRGLVDGEKTHWVSVNVMEIGETSDEPVSYREKSGVSRFAGGQKGHYRYSVTEALFNAPEGTAHNCDEAAVKRLASDIAARLP